MLMNWSRVNRRRPLAGLRLFAQVLLAVTIGACPAAPVKASDGMGVFIPVAADTENSLPSNLKSQFTAYDLCVVTNLAATDENLQAVAEMGFQFGVTFQTGTNLCFAGMGEIAKKFHVQLLHTDPATYTWKILDPERLVTAKVWDQGMPVIRPMVGTTYEWANDNPDPAPPRAILDVLGGNPRGIFTTKDTSLHITRPAANQVHLVIPIYGPGQRFQHQPELAALLKSMGMNFEPYKGGELQEIMAPDPNGGAPKKVQVPGPGLLRVTLSDTQAITYLTKLATLPKEFEGGLRLSAARVVLTFRIPGSLDQPGFGPALRLQAIRMTSRALPGKKALASIPIERFEIVYLRYRPDRKTLATLLKMDVDDVEFIDRYQRTAVMIPSISRFSGLPLESAIRLGRFEDNAVKMHTDKRYITPSDAEMAGVSIRCQAYDWVGPLLYEDSLDAVSDLAAPNRVRFDGIQKNGNDKQLIGHVYYAYNGLGMTKDMVNSSGAKESVSIHRSAFANSSNSSTQTNATEIELSAKGGLKDVFEIGGKVTGSQSNSQQSGTGTGSGKDDTRSMEIAIPAVFSSGAITLVEYPVFVTRTQLGTPKFSFDSDEKLAHGPSATIVEYRTSKGSLRKVVTDTDENNAGKTNATLGDEISGTHLNVVRTLFPSVQTSSKPASVFAGQWRITDLNDGDVIFATVDAAGLLTDDGDAAPTEKLELVKGQAGKVTMMQLEDKTSEVVDFKVSKSQAAGVPGDDSKIVFSVNGKATAMWIRVGGAKSK